MPAHNTTTGYGAVSKALHWAIAALVLTMIPLGLVAVEWRYDTSDALATKALLFSIHKTLGVAVFFLALVRIGWMLGQPRPVPLRPERRLETALAEGVHWLLYVSLVAVPLSGWVQHAAAAGFAPIWWPFAQTLPFVPRSADVAAAAGAVHATFTKLLMAALALHVAGALKHHLVDRDGTLARMLPGRLASAATAPVPVQRRALAPVLGALVVYGLVGGAVVTLAQGGGDTDARPGVALPATPVAATSSSWIVESGELTFTVRQMGSPVTGRFARFDADIAFEETPDADGRHGFVTVAIPIASMTLGSVTEQARGPEFFDAESHPAARFAADIVAAEKGGGEGGEAGGEEGGYRAQGTLALAGAEVPVALPFTLDIVDGVATASGTVTVDRRDFGMGESYPDEATVGFSVEIGVSLTARRGGAGEGA
ncbi:cytochrome b/b6 domain-containing protein [Salinarimonas rosea]|uniref:cytochrome b/b6 domain-containing protein n=1 Tax=Salinarimonas rosea TaxID=552063 RepID=UPI00041800E5|nr:cytochrome b/b6 domain-containing protein [Salinarimonas rosea]